MNNDVELIPVKVVLPSVQVQSDNVIYVPQAHKNKAGIVKEGDGVLIENGVVSLNKQTVEDMIDANKWVSYGFKQNLTEDEKGMARHNIGAGDNYFTGSYYDLTQKPHLNTNNTTGLDYGDEELNDTINLHKISKTGSFNDLNHVPQETLAFAESERQKSQTDGAIVHEKELSNPNLLINGDFRVNQRGKTSYVSDATIYTVDRWKTNISDKNISVTVVPQENGILLTYTSGSSGHSVLMQELETSDVLSLKGKILTLSYKITQITNSCRIRVLAGGNTTLFTEIINESGTFSKSFEFPETATGLSVRIISNSTENTIGIEYIKLEVGSSATAFCPRPYAEELALCQRYNVDLIRNTTGYPYVAMGFARNETQLFVVLNLPQAMRVRPTVFVYEGLYLQGSNKSNELLTSSNITFGGFATNGNQISLTITTTGLTAGQCYALQLRDDGHIGIDAEIY